MKNTKEKMKSGNVVVLAICALLLLSLSVTMNASAQEEEKIVYSGSKYIDLNRVEKINPPVINVVEGSELIINPGFETGDLPPWYTNAWIVVTDNPHSGIYNAYDIGNNWTRQDFIGVPVSEISSVTFWSRQPEEAIQAVDLFYDDGTFTENIVYPKSIWQQFDITSWLTPGKVLTGIRIWGYSGGGPALDETYVDDISILTISAKPTVSISTDKPVYAPGETVQLSIRISNPTSTTYASSLGLDIFWPSGTGTNVLSKSFTMTPGFSVVKVVPIQIPNSLFVANGEYKFTGTLTYDSSVVTSTALFSIMRP